MQKREYRVGMKRIAVLFAATFIGLAGCGSSMQGNGQTVDGQMADGSGIANADGQGVEANIKTTDDQGAKTDSKTADEQGGKTSGLSKNTEPAVREIYDVMTVPYMRLQAYGDHAEEALDLGVEKIHSIYDLLSTGNPDSEVGKLNANGSGVLGEDGIFLLETSLNLYKETDRAFDVSVYPLMELWGFTNLYKESLTDVLGKSDDSDQQESKEHKVPSDAEIQETLKKVDSSKIEYNPETGDVTLPDGMKIDFGGIAKGYASESVAEILRDNGVESALLNLGGNIQTIGRKPDGSKWRIALNDRNKGGFLGILTVEDSAVITSGGYERKFEDADGNVYFHILDPKTGYPADNGFSADASVTIICKDGTMADALSTAMYVLGPEKAEEYWKKHSDEFQMIMMTDDDKMYVTEGIADDYQSDYKFEVIKA
ncbi:MAG: FAD:protein FMN transferase [Lachnospiraceae bacterium]|nr:FAD:protein FMN transferase [Lachnospiraceae bacterium]